MCRVACKNCRNRFDEAELTKLPFGDMICDGCMEKECEMMERDMATNNDDISLVESDDESSFSWDEDELSPYSSSTSSSSSSSSSLNKENNNNKLPATTNHTILKTVDDLIR